MVKKSDHAGRGETVPCPVPFAIFSEAGEPVFSSQISDMEALCASLSDSCGDFSRFAAKEISAESEVRLFPCRCGEYRLAVAVRGRGQHFTEVYLCGGLMDMYPIIRGCGSGARFPDGLVRDIIIIAGQTSEVASEPIPCMAAKLFEKVMGALFRVTANEPAMFSALSPSHLTFARPAGYAALFAMCYFVCGQPADGTEIRLSERGCHFITEIKSGILPSRGALYDERLVVEALSAFAVSFGMELCYTPAHLERRFSLEILAGFEPAQPGDYKFFDPTGEIEAAVERVRSAFGGLYRRAGEAGFI